MSRNETSSRPTPAAVQPRTHFQVTAREMLLDEPICCPLYGALSFDGLAIDDQQGVHLVIRTAAARAYLGSNADTVARRAYILAVALVHGGVIAPDRAPGIAGWIGQCWSAAMDEINVAAAATRSADALISGTASRNSPYTDLTPQLDIDSGASVGLVLVHRSIEPTSG